MPRTRGHARITDREHPACSLTPTAAPRPPAPTTTGPSPHTTPDQGPLQSLNPEADGGQWAKVAVWEDTRALEYIFIVSGCIPPYPTYISPNITPHLGTGYNEKYNPEHG